MHCIPASFTGGGESRLVDQPGEGASLDRERILVIEGRGYRILVGIHGHKLAAVSAASDRAVALLRLNADRLTRQVADEVECNPSRNDCHSRVGHLHIGQDVAH